MANEIDQYCVPGATNFNKVYSRLHGYIAIVICIVGSATNSINITVLSRREMISPTNSILTGLAVADLLVMLEYIPYVLHMNIKIGPQLNKNTYAWAVFVYFHSIFSQTFHTISTWLAVTLAVWRYIAIAFPHRNRTWCSKRNTAIAIISAYVICPFLCLPIYFAMNITKSEVTQQNNSEFAEDLSLPYNRTPEKECLAEESCSGRKTNRTDRTTRMLLAVLGLFLSTEVPQGLLGLASALAPDFFKSCYNMFGE
ncbi:unnamed protein product [Leptidea sinapis]|uniref:G-protein coupled receptors family 1 profile domain-containing protein n=1 Tax=Leptidea sinapis TaxID=189913 RepID=A0A5E4QM79_9NEOP|nr:unnamed protein product [Leptidea sinapis]